MLVDTGGFGAEAPRDGATIAARVREQALAAMTRRTASCASSTARRAWSRRTGRRALLRRSGKPVLWVVNKIDTGGREALRRLLGRAGREPLAVSAAHGRGIGELRSAISPRCPSATPASESDAARGSRSSGGRTSGSRRC
jgi:predicted GTPase